MCGYHMPYIFALYITYIYKVYIYFLMDLLHTHGPYHKGNRCYWQQLIFNCNETLADM